MLMYHTMHILYPDSTNILCELAGYNLALRFNEHSAHGTRLSKVEFQCLFEQNSDFCIQMVRQVPIKKVRNEEL